MKVVLAVLANSANVSTEGNLNILGAFDSIPAPSFPAQHPSMVLAFRIRGEYEDQFTAHTIKITLLDADSNQYWQAVAEIKMGDVKPGQFAHNNQILTFRGLVFPRDGRYRFAIEIGEGDTVERADVVFQLVKVEVDAAPG